MGREPITTRGKGSGWLALILATSLAIFGSTSAAGAGDIHDAPHDLGAALVLKLLTFARFPAGTTSLTIYVLGPSALESEFKKGVGMAFGKHKLTKVSRGEALPKEPPSILVVSKGQDLKAVLDYAREKNVLTATLHPNLVRKGITLGIGIQANKPKVLLNTTSSKEENVSWAMAIFKIAEVLK